MSLWPRSPCSSRCDASAAGACCHHLQAARLPIWSPGHGPRTLMQATRKQPARNKPLLSRRWGRATWSVAMWRCSYVIFTCLEMEQTQRHATTGTLVSLSSSCAFTPATLSRHKQPGRLGIPSFRLTHQRTLFDSIPPGIVVWPRYRNLPQDFLELSELRSDWLGPWYSPPGPTSNVQRRPFIWGESLPPSASRVHVRCSTPNPAPFITS
jgi:hypothetical protein